MEPAERQAAGQAAGQAADQATGGRAVAAIAACLVLFPRPLPALPLIALVGVASVVGVAPRSARAFAGAAGLLGLALLAAPATGVALSAAVYAWAACLGFAWAVLLQRPEIRFTVRALLAVALAGLVAAAALAVSGTWDSLDAAFRSFIEEAGRVTYQRLVAQYPEMSNIGSAVPRVLRGWWALWPALLALESLAAVALGWWFRVRLARTPDDTPRPWGRFREFRFPDELIWLLVAGLSLLALPLEGALNRVGANAAIFMGALYAVRGAAVFVFWMGGRVPAPALIALALMTLLLPWALLPGAALLGLGDTWLNMRFRVARTPEP